MLGFLKRLFEPPGKQPIRRGPQLQTALTRQRDAETGLQQSEEHFAQLVAGVRDYAVFLLDRDGNILTWNSGAERIKGYRAEEIIGENFSRFYPKESVASGWPAHELEVAAATGRFEDQGWRLRKDGSKFWADVVITALRDDSGTVRGFLKITRDLTDRKHADEKLRMSEERFRLLVEGVRDYAIFMLDPNGQVATWNAGAEKLKGYSADEIIGQHFSRFYPPEAIAKGWPDEELRRAIADGRIEDEGWRVRKDGSMFWANVVITALWDPMGKLRGFAKVTRDLTERRQSEENARRLLQEQAARKAAEASELEARRAREEERRHREQLRVTLASIGDAVIVTDTDGIVAFMNPISVELTGWKPEEAAGQPLQAVFPVFNELTRQPAENPVTKALREGLVVGLANHSYLVTRHGREIPIDDSAAPIRGEDGAITGVVLVFRDVTEARKSVDARLHLASIVESSDDAIISNDTDGIIQSWNRGAERLYGYSAEEIIGKPLSIVAPPDDPDELPEILDRIKRGERIEHFETTRLRKDGTLVDVSLTISPVRNAKGTVVGASKIARDMTARKREEAAWRFLAEASKLLGHLLDVSSTLQQIATLAVPQYADWCAVDMADEDGLPRRVAIAHIDPEKVRLAEEMNRRYPVRPTDLNGPANVLRTGKAEMMSEISDAVLRGVAGDEDRIGILRTLGLRSYISVPLTARGRTIGALTFVVGESRRRFQREDLQIAEDLGQRASAAIENSQLYEALREQDRRKTEFLAVLAHELRNPLAPLRSGLEVMRLAGGDPQRIEQTRAMMERQLRHLARLVDDLLDVSRISQGKIELRKERMDVSDVVGSALDVCGSLVRNEDHPLTVKTPGEKVYVDADKTRLAQAICNLLHNAVKFSEPGSPIFLSAERDGNQAVIRVKDSGVGIPASMLSKVFDMFTQVDRTMEKSQGGLGIGLTLVRSLVELHGGKVEAHSEGPGKGSEFIIRLPVVHAPAPEPQDEGYETPRSGFRRRILVADDNVDAANSLAMILSILGSETRTAHDGLEAVEVAEAFRPDLIFLDIGMPRLSGHEACRRIREQSWGHGPRIIALTGWGQDEDKRRSQEAGFDDHLIKPVEPAAVERLLADLDVDRSADVESGEGEGRVVAGEMTGQPGE